MGGKSEEIKKASQRKSPNLSKKKTVEVEFKKISPESKSGRRKSQNTSGQQSPEIQRVGKNEHFHGSKKSPEQTKRKSPDNQRRKSPPQPKQSPELKNASKQNHLSTNKKVADFSEKGRKHSNSSNEGEQSSSKGSRVRSITPPELAGRNQKIISEEQFPALPFKSVLNSFNKG